MILTKTKFLSHLIQVDFWILNFGESSKEHVTVKLILNVYQTTSSEFLVAETDFCKII